MTLIEVLASLPSILILVPLTVLTVQVIFALPKRHVPRLRCGHRPTAAIIVPAHDEAAVIADTIRSILPQLRSGDRFVVVADNCTDNTAKIAAEMGAEVIERKDHRRRGKGYALDFGIRHLGPNPREVVVVIDADCRVEPQAVDTLVRHCADSCRPVQALDLMRSPDGADARTRIAEFAWLIKNKIRPLGYYRLGLPCQLMGTGMAFPWPCIASAPIATAHIVEDMMLGISLARSGAPPLFCPDALITSYFPVDPKSQLAQRTRWEHGHVGMIIGSLPRLLAESLLQRNSKLMAMALDLTVPPLTLLGVLVLCALAASTIFFVSTGMAMPFWLAGASCALLTVSILLCWARYGRRLISIGTLAYAPIYALWKLPLYLKFLTAKQTEWIRARRGE